MTIGQPYANIGSIYRCVWVMSFFRHNRKDYQTMQRGGTASDNLANHTGVSGSNPADPDPFFQSCWF